MSEVARLLAQDNDLIAYLRSLVDRIPENRELPPPQFFMDPRSLSMLNMIKGGATTALNWLEGKPEIGPDTIAPLGLSAMGMALVQKNALGSAGGKLTASSEKGISQAAGHSASSPSPNPLLDDLARDQTGHRPASYLDPQAPGGRSSIANDPSSGTSELPLAPAVRAAFDDPRSYYGVRITEEPLRVGQVAPESRQWYQDFVSEADPHYGRERFPDHNEPLGGTSTVGLTGVDDLGKIRDRARGYFGDHVAIVRGTRKWEGADPGEWVIPDAEVVATARRPSRDVDLFADTTKSSLPGLLINAQYDPVARLLAGLPP